MIGVRNLKSAIKYTISLGVGVLLLWYVYKDKNLPEMWQSFMNAEAGWVILSFFFAILSHLIRAVRWNLLMEPVGLRPSAYNSFLAVLVGYLANIVLPRMGEFSRCAVLNRTDKIPLNKSFGTVVTERIFDVVVLLIITIIGLAIEFDRLKVIVTKYVVEPWMSKDVGGESFYGLYIAAGIFLALVAGVYLIYRGFKTRIHQSAIFLKIREFISGLMEGITSIRHMKKKGQFIFLTVAMWGCYFLMSFVMFYALQETSHLGFNAGLGVLVLGGIGMAAPVQGGVGAYHFLISRGLVAYGVTVTVGEYYAAFVHGAQMILYIAAGLISLLLVMMKSKKSTNSDSEMPVSTVNPVQETETEATGSN